MTGIVEKNTRTGFEIAVIGMTGRFPGAESIAEFWSNLRNGVESITFLSDKEIGEGGITAEWLRNPNFVKSRGGVLEGKKFFDASFFGYSPREAEIMDPQVRLLHECVWTALEDAGYSLDAYNGLIGLYAGCASNFEWEALSMLSGKSYEFGLYPASHLVDTGYLSTRVSYKLNLRGPSVTVQTACSTALVAIHMACRALISCECDMALAGGVSISPVMDQGYIYEEGLIFSADGHCRAFDIHASGTIIGDGAGIVVLKSLEDALEDRDHIYAIIKSSAINNDGIRKVGYAASSVEGQAEVIRAAHHMAEVEPESIAYVETHGTGTILGDPIEIEALRLAFKTDKRGFCKIGSVKTNVGHLDRAAGVAGFIKTVLMLKHKQIPPSLNFQTPNPKIDLENSPFRVCTHPSEWKNDGYPLRAGVSSFGIGGTNAHVVLEEWPDAQSAEQRVSGPDPVGANPVFARDAPQLILLSAKTRPALENMSENLVNYLKKHSGNFINPGNHVLESGSNINLADAAYTLQIGRCAFRHRKMLLCKSLDEAIDSLSAADPEKVQTYLVKDEDRPVIFMFPGQGSQYVDMGLELYKSESLFREEMERCFEILNHLLDYDLREILYPGFLPTFKNAEKSPPRRGAPKGRGGLDINRTEIAQPVIFIVAYALARLLIKWGIKPKAMIGHSIGEYVAACLSGVFSLEDALKLVVHRGKLMQQMPAGSMLSVPISEEEVNPLLKDKELSLAAVNSSQQCVISGSHEAVDNFAKELEKKGYKTRRLITSHAFHSQMMEPIMAKFADIAKKVKLSKPNIPYISNVSGTWIKTGETVDPVYWSKQIRSTVRFAQGLKELLKEKNALLVEVGPGKALCTFVRQHKNKKPGQQVFNLVRHTKEEVSDHYYLLNRIGQLWLYGVKIDWAGFYSQEKRYRIPLPTYPFERLPYWIEGNPFKIGLEMMAGTTSLQKKPHMADWFYIPSWERCLVRDSTTYKKQDKPGLWLVFIDRCGPGVRLVERLEQEQEEVITVRIGSEFKRISNREYILDPAANEDYDSLFGELKNKEKVPDRIAHFWTVTGDSIMEPDLETIDRIQDTGLFSLLSIVQAIGRQGIAGSIQIGVVSDGIHEVTGEEFLCPGKATLLGAVKVIPLEYPNIECKNIDIVYPGQIPSEPVDVPGSIESREDRFIDLLLQELHSNDSRKIVALRGNYCWVPVVKPIRLNDPGAPAGLLRERGVYVITGGMGGMGFTLADYLARSLKARLILLGRSPFPPRDEWDNWLAAHGPEDKVSLKIEKIREWLELGAEVNIFSADIANPEQVQEMFSQAREQFGTINGVLHTAGLADYEGVIQRRTREMTESVMAPKVKGTLVLDKALKDSELDFLVLFSSLANNLYLGNFGQVGYNAANEFLEAYACYKTYRDRLFTIAINWCAWLEVGMAVEAIHRRVFQGRENFDLETQSYAAVTPEEGVDVFNRILGNKLTRVAVSTRDLNSLLARQEKGRDDESISREDSEEEALHTSYGAQQRPELSSEYIAPTNEIEQELAKIWQRFFGIRQVGIYDDFFELGGDSLQVMSVASHIHKALNFSIPMQVFFDRPTIKKLAEYIAESSEKTGLTAIEPVEEREYYSLSSAQKRIYILQQMDKNNISYNQPILRTLDMELDREKIDETFKKLIRRHESLRTSFELIEAKPIQKIHKPREIEFALEYYDADGRSPQHIIRDFVRPFDLPRPPLCRTGLVKVNDGKYILMADLHHIISDGGSNMIIIDEFIRLYDGQELPRLRIRYKDFSQWQNQQLAAGETKRQERYWLAEFSGEIPLLNLPGDYARPEVQSFAGDKIYFHIGKDEFSELKQIVKLTDSTMFMVLLALYNILLSKLSGQEDIITGTVAAGRGHPGLENIIGMFVNTLALRNYPAGEKTFTDFLKEVKARTLAAFDNQDYQFEDLVDKLQVTRDTGRNPIFDVMFTYISEVVQNFSPAPAQSSQQETSDINTRSSSYDDTQSKFDLILVSIERIDRLIFVFVYSTKLFKRETIERFIKYFKEIVSAVTTNKDIRLKDIEVSHDLGRVKADVYQGKESDFEF